MLYTTYTQHTSNSLFWQWQLQQADNATLVAKAIDVPCHIQHHRVTISGVTMTAVLIVTARPIAGCRRAKFADQNIFNSINSRSPLTVKYLSSIWPQERDNTAPVPPLASFDVTMHNLLSRFYHQLEILMTSASNLLMYCMAFLYRSYKGLGFYFSINAHAIPHLGISPRTRESQRGSGSRLSYIPFHLSITYRMMA